MSKRAAKTSGGEVREMSPVKAALVMDRLNPIQDLAYTANIAFNAVAAANEEIYDRISEVRCGEMSVRDAANYLLYAAHELESANRLPLNCLKDVVRVYRHAARQLDAIHVEFKLAD